MNFIGFELLAQIAAQIAQRYRVRFPADPAMRDLGSWHLFETENPHTFGAMYIFWVQKPVPASD